MNKIIIVLLTIIMSGVTYAHQIKAANDDATLHFNLSNKDYTRIFVTGDRISSIKGQQSLYEVKEFKDGSEEGILYLRPITSLTNEPFNIFIETESGHHFTLNLHPINQASANIEIKPLSPIKKLAGNWEQNADYTQTLIELMREMVNNSQPEGYAVISLDATKARPLSNGLSMQLVKLYHGNFLRGEVWLIKNETTHTTTLLPKTFYRLGVRALSLAKETIAKGNCTYLYRIVSDE